MSSFRAMPLSARNLLTFAVYLSASSSVRAVTTMSSTHLTTSPSDGSSGSTRYASSPLRIRFAITGDSLFPVGTPPLTCSAASVPVHPSRRPRTRGARRNCSRTDLSIGTLSSNHSWDMVS